MKKTIFLLLASMLVSCKTIGQTLSIEQLGMSPRNGAYYKDTENLLNNFVGTWLYTNGNTSLKFVLKKVKRYNTNYSEDILVGEYQYIENGTEKINTLGNVSDFTDKKIKGNSVVYYDSKPPCNDCTANEKRLRVTFSDPVKNTAGALYLRKIMVSGQEAISAWFLCDGFTYTGGPDPENIVQTYVGETVPNGTYVLIKQP